MLVASVLGHATSLEWKSCGNNQIYRYSLIYFQTLKFQSQKRRKPSSLFCSRRRCFCFVLVVVLFCFRRLFCFVIVVVVAVFGLFSSSSLFLFCSRCRRRRLLSPASVSISHYYQLVTNRIIRTEQQPFAIYWSYS